MDKSIKVLRITGVNMVNGESRETNLPVEKEIFKDRDELEAFRAELEKKTEFEEIILTYIADWETNKS